MSRALLLASLLAAPALAVAQAPIAGQIIFQNGRDFPMFVNSLECGSHAQVSIIWTPILLGGTTTIPGAAQYNMYASNVDPATNGAGANTCFKTTNSGTNPVTANQITNIGGVNPPITTTAVIDLTDFINAAGFSCASNGSMLWICIEGIAGGVKFGYAASSVTISTAIPPPPTISGITPGDGALNVSWDAGFQTSTFPGDNYAYRLEAVMAGTTVVGVTDPNPHVSSQFTATNARFDGLVNSVTYNVTVTTFSKGGSPSDPSAPVQGTPQAVLDFFDTYKNAPYNGRDVGCASGLSGPLALALVAGALALARRRR
jgi:hypothetical protein